MRFQSMPYAPGGEELMGHNGAFRRDRMGTLALLTQSTHPVLRLRIPWPGVRAFAITDPEVVQEALVEKARHFDKSDMLRFSLWNLAGEGLFTSNGELWKRQRKLMAPLFTPKALEAYAADMVECSHRTMGGWRDGQELALSNETTRLTMGIAGKTLFDADTFSEADEIGEALTVALDWTSYVMGRPFSVAHVIAKRLLERAGKGGSTRLERAALAAQARFHGPIALVGERGRELRRAIQFLDDHVQKMIDVRRGSAKPQADLLSRLLSVRDEEGGAGMSDRQVRDEVLTLFVAGHETPATGLAWTVYLAGRDPAVYAAMEREVDAVGDDPKISDLPRLELCVRAFKEALRIYPPVYMFGRDSRGDVTLAGYELPERSNALISPWGVHHSARFWPDPERFDPDRFLPANEAKRHRYAYLPFGAGTRVCLGNHFAYMEAALVLAVLLRRFRFEVIADEVPEPIATLRPKNGVRVRVHRREHARVFSSATA
ncbi:cytochrome P450 [soil metagenome]